MIEVNIFNHFLDLNRRFASNKIRDLSINFPLYCFCSEKKSKQ